MTGERAVVDDVETLKALLLAERARVAERDQKISELEHKLYVWGKLLWGPRTEKRPQEPAPAPGQIWLPFADLLDAAQRVADRHGAHGSITVEAPTEQKAGARGRRRSEFPEHLPGDRTSSCGQAKLVGEE